MSTGNTYTIVVPDGDPDSIKIVNKGNWVGSLVQFSRESYKNNRNTTPYKETLDRPGVYILIGPDEQNESSSGIKVYIGEGDGIKGRIESHFINKDFWDTVLIITAENESFDKVQIQYIESKLVQIAMNAKTCTLENGNSPNPPSTSLAARINADNSIIHILDCVQLLGYTMFVTAQANPQSHQASTTSAQSTAPGTNLDQPFFFNVKVRNSQANAVGSYQNGKLVVSKGSMCTHDVSDSCPESIVLLKQQLEAQQIIQRSGPNQAFVFTQDYAFKSPSAAAGVISGRSSNGLIDWKTQQGVTLGTCLTQ
jgi:hypothetical protein